TVERALAMGLDPQRYLDDNDSNTFFRALGDLIMTGPTGTNVNDIMIAMRNGL
ncbi:MAG: glycerate kinase, partial [Nitrososphaerota archaeon]|nr:glycerate kinase [Nitrososphaerota archaeon]